MMGTFSSVALLSYLGYEKARAVLCEMTRSERFRLAIDVSTSSPDDTAVHSTIHTVYSHLEHGDGGDCTESWCSDSDWVQEVCSLTDKDVARTISYLKASEAAMILERIPHRASYIAQECSRISTLDYFGTIVSELTPSFRDEILDIIAQTNFEIASQLQIRFNGFIDILDLEYDELSAMLGGGPVEEIASALIASGNNFA